MNRFLRWLFPPKRVHSGHVGGINSSSSPYWKNNLKSERPTMSESTRTLKTKTYKVNGNGKTYLADATTAAGAINAVKDSLKRQEDWSAELATGEELYQAGADKTPIIGRSVPEPQVDPAQTDAFGDIEGEKS